MKIVYIDTGIDGHHITYLKCLADASNAEITAMLPEKVEDIKCEQYIYQKVDMYNKKNWEFAKWSRELYRKIKEIKPDIIHVLTADSYLKYFGYGLFKLKRICPMVVTLHWCREGKLQTLSRRRISRACSYMVVHSEYLLEELRKEGIQNGVCIEYPQFKENKYASAEAKRRFDLRDGIPVIGAIGNTRDDKGLDLLLKALSQIDLPFQLLIAGKQECFDEKYIQKESVTYKDKVYTCLKYLSDEEFDAAIAASDIIALPYRWIFNGASGPLIEGANLGKCIIGSGHGNLGDTIRRYHLGYCFETENINNLAETLKIALSNQFCIDSYYREFQKKINPEKFCDSYMKLYSNCMTNKER